MNRVQNTKTVLWTLVGLAAAVGLTRFIFGLGATTNLTDATPWGLWIGFDVMAGVALAGGGFVLTAFFYIFKQEKYHSLARPAVLTAFLGYLAVIFGLTFDVGLPWNLWHMLIHWNPHSPLFEVGWCVMLYTAVLLLEFLPVPLENTSRWAKIREFLVKFKLPLVLLGIMLSTLHQSSLGSLFLIMPHHLHPFEYLFGLHGTTALSPWMWVCEVLTVGCVIALLLPGVRKQENLLACVCVAVIAAVWIEKGMGLIIPGFVPSTLHEIVEYAPSEIEWKVMAGGWALGLMVFTVRAVCSKGTDRITIGPCGVPSAFSKPANGSKTG